MPTAANPRKGSEQVVPKPEEHIAGQELACPSLFADVLKVQHHATT
jgi:hypothetical protein